MKNGEKTRLGWLRSYPRYYVTIFVKVLTTLCCSTMFILQEDATYCLTESGVTVKEELPPNHEEADMKVILHCYHSMQEDPSSKVVLRSLSRDTDILVLATALLDSNRAYLDYWKGKLRKGFLLNQVVIEDQLKTALIGYHSFTGNDYIFSFFKKGKQMCRKALKKNRIFDEAFSLLGKNWSIDVGGGILPVLEQYVCTIFGYPGEKSAKLSDKNSSRSIQREEK